MCFDADSAPPVPAGPQAAEERLITLTASDGTELAASQAVPEQPSGAAIVILPDVRGLYGFYRQLGLRFAENGITAVVPDYYGRTAGVGVRDGDFAYQEHMRRLTPAGMHADLGAAVAAARVGGPGGAAPERVYTAGFCLGGRLAVLAGARQAGHDLAGTIGFYCWPAPGPDGAPGPTQRAGDLVAPVLALMAGDDPGIPAEHVEDFDQALTAAGLPHEVVTYPGAPHSFFDVKQEQHREASQDAWRRVLSFIG